MPLEEGPYFLRNLTAAGERKVINSWLCERCVLCVDRHGAVQLPEPGGATPSG